MVKKLDKKFSAVGPDHVGIRLWIAYEAWKEEFVRAMNEAGHTWFTPSRATLLGFLPRNGARQTLLIERMGISKQAVQQLIDGLEAEGIVERTADPDDRRGKIVRYKMKGLAALDDADAIKRQIESRYRRRMGTGNFAQLVELLGKVQPDN
jgi:DNA-binding MarR family transcriptional regulator